MSSNRRALIVEDDPDVRSLTSRAMALEGFATDEAPDGACALALLEYRQYDVLITDLRMPSVNGHHLCCEAMKLQPRPVVVVLTAVAEPRLVKDLIARGIDNICFKPVDYIAFAAKVAALVETAGSQCAPPQTPSAVKSMNQPAAKSQPDTKKPEPEIVNGIIRTRPTEVIKRLEQQAVLPPVSPVAMRIYELVRDEDIDTHLVAKALQKDPSLAMQVLKMANSAAFNRSGERIASLERGITQIGLMRVGELALAASTSNAFNDSDIEWLNPINIWKRTLASHAVLRAMLPHVSGVRGESLLLAALLHVSGRVVLSKLFPEVYESIHKQIVKGPMTLQDAEEQAFGMDQAEALAQLSSFWELPKEILEPIKFINKTMQQVEHCLDEQASREVALLQTAIFAARAELGIWEPWETVSIPPATGTQLFTLEQSRKVPEQCRAAIDYVDKLVSGLIHESSEERKKPGKRGEDSYVLNYIRPEKDGYDAIEHFLEGLGFELRHVEPDNLADLSGPFVVNGCHLESHTLVKPLHALQGLLDRSLLLLGLNETPPTGPTAPPILRLPVRYSILQRRLEKLTQEHSSFDRELRLLTS